MNAQNPTLTYWKIPSGNQIAAVLSVLIVLIVAIIVIFTIEPLRRNTSLLPFLGSVIVAERLLGFRAAVVVAVASSAAWIYFVQQPSFKFEIHSDDLVRLTFFLGLSTAICYVIDRLERNRKTANFKLNQISETLSQTHVGLFQYERGSGVFWTSPQLELLLGGSSKSKICSLSNFQASINADFRQPFLSKISNLSLSNPSFEIECRFTNSREAALLIINSQHDCDGNLVRLFGTVLSTKPKNFETAL